MAKIPEEIIRSVQESVDIVDVIERFVSLKRAGSSFKGLCPFHEEKTPSFHVFPSSGRFKCFGCGEGGDVIAFLMRRNNLSFPEVLEELAREANIELPSSEDGPEEAERAHRRGNAMEALRFAAGFFRVILDRETGRSARGYLESRGFDAETLDEFNVGFAPDEFEGLLGYARTKGVSEEALFDAGLVRRNERGSLFDMFRGRVMFPIHDLRGRVVGFGARAMGDAQPKYLNSAQGLLFDKSREMYGLHLARAAAIDAGRLIVVEGYTDVMHCHQAGLREVAAGLGTALTPDNARQMRRFGVPVFLVYDGDEAGRRAAERAAEILLAEKVEGAVALLPPGRDPAEIVREEGAAGLETALEKAQALWDYRLERAEERHGTAGLDGREKVVAELIGPIERIADPIRRDMALRLLAERTGVPESTIRNQTRGSAVSRGRDVAALPDRPAAPAWADAERDLVAAMLHDETFHERAEGIYPADGYRDAAMAALAHGIGNLRSRGESVTREALLGAVASDDATVRALQSIEPEEGSRERAEKHLADIDKGQRLRAALGSRDLMAVVRARKASDEAADDRHTNDDASANGET